MKLFLNAYLFLILGFLSSVQAQQNQVYFEKFDVIAGLPESSVTCMVEDDLGYIWMGTQNGLVRYDGYEYKIYQLGTKKTNIDPITSVVTLFLDNNNILWASTNPNGLFKYNRDSDTFTQFVYPENDKAISYDIFTQDKKGNLWGTASKDSKESYLWKLDPKGHFDFFGKQFKNTNQINASQINSAFTSQSGKVWFGTNNGFYCYQGNNKPLKGFATSNDSLQRLDVGFIYEAPTEKEVLWMVNLKENKIIRFDVKTEAIKTFQPQPYSFNFPSFETNFIRYFNNNTSNNIYEDKNKQLWFAAYDGMVRFNRKTATFGYFKTGFDKEDDNYKKYFSHITASKDGKLWLTSLGGLVYFNPKTGVFERYLSDAEHPGAVLENSRIRQKMIDHTGTLWLGFMWAGANKSNAKKSSFNIYKNNPKQADSYPKEGARPALGKNGYLWFSDQKNIYKWKPNTNSFTKTYTVDKGETYYGRGYLNNDGNFWITTDKNLVFYNLQTGKKEKYPTDKIVKDGILNSPTEDYNGIIWLEVARDKGIVSFDPKTKKFKHYPYRENREKATPQNAGALDDGRVISTYVDKQHQFWVGTNFGSINLYDPIKDNFISYLDTEDNNQMVCIADIFEDSAGRFWAGTYQAGLFEFDRKKGKWTRHLDEASGLLFNSILGINEDAAGQLWISSDRGLSRVNPKDLSVKNFPINTILTGNTMAHSQQQLYKLDDGKLMTMLTDGVVVFDPADLNANPFTPKVQLESISVINPDAKTDEFKSILTYGKKEIHLTYEQNRIRFNYVGLQYDDPATNTYAYKLEGYDNEWVQAGTQRTVTYTNLSPGEYIFQVKAANSDGVWSTENASIHIIISPPWWKTWWAYLIYVLIFISLLRIYIVFRARKLKRENKILEEKVTHRTSQLTKSIEDLKTTQNQLIQSEKMASLGELTAGIAHEIQNPLNFINNFSEVSNELIDEMNEEIEKGDMKEAKAISIDIKQNLEKINHHGKRADAIVKGMLQHSRSSSGIKEPTDLNALCDEYLRLSYHGLRAKDKSFNATIKTDFDESIGKINIIPQDFGRVILNLLTNAFYAVTEKKNLQTNDGKIYEPTVAIATKKENDKIIVTVTDNGNGMPQEIIDKVFQPFFTTKPTGKGTGLGLSMSYDIITKGHGGELKVVSKKNEQTEFIISIPIKNA